MEVLDEEIVEDTCEVKCLEQVLQKLTTFISLSEMEKISKIIELSDCAIRVAAQLHFVRTGKEANGIDGIQDDIDEE